MEKQEVAPMESIKTIDDALNATGMPVTPEFNEVPEGETGKSKIVRCCAL